MGRSRTSSLVAMLSCLLLLSGAPPPTEAATNSAYGGIRGLNNGTLLGGDGTGTAQFTLHSHRLALVKQARDLEGRVLPRGQRVDAGTEIYFLLLVENPTNAPARDIRLLDRIDTDQFRYIPGSLELGLASMGVDVWQSDWRPLTDEVGLGGDPDDGASAGIGLEGGRIDQISLGAQAEQANLRIDLDRGSVLALRFRARVE